MARKPGKSSSSVSRDVTPWHIGYTFAVQGTQYFLPHTPYAPGWELMTDEGDEFVTITTDRRVITGFLREAKVPGILTPGGTLPSWEEESAR